MTTERADLDTETLADDLHGQRVSQTGLFVCDYCESEIQIGEPVLYEAIRVGEMPNLKAVFNIPTGWILDAVRCQACDIDAIKPATDGFDEALVMLTVDKINGVRSVDASQLTVVDYSPDGQGYYPPPVDPRAIAQTEDLGQARWIRMKYLLNTPEFTRQVSPEYLDAITQGRDVPPGINI